MAVDAILIYGIRFYYSSDGVTYTELADMKSLGAPGAPQSPKVDITPLYDTTAFRQFRLGLAVAGEMEFEQFYKKTRMTLIQSLYRQQIYWRIVYPDGTTVNNSSKTEFIAWLADYTPPAAGNADDTAVIKGKLVLTGAPTFTAGV